MPNFRLVSATNRLNSFCGRGDEAIAMDHVPVNSLAHARAVGNDPIQTLRGHASVSRKGYYLAWLLLYVMFLL